MDARWRASGIMSNVSGASGYAAVPMPSCRGIGSRRSCNVHLYRLCVWFTVFTVAQRQLDLRSRMREFCTSGSVGAPAEQSLGRPDNSKTLQLQNAVEFFRGVDPQSRASVCLSERRQSEFSCLYHRPLRIYDTNRRLECKFEIADCREKSFSTERPSSDSHRLWAE